MTDEKDDALAAYGGMTLNERLAVSGLIGKWDAALQARDRATLVAILRDVAVGRPEDVADRLLAGDAG